MAERPDHTPVLLQEVLAALHPVPGARLVDATLGLGGHAAALLSHTGPNGQLLGLDRDRDALGIARDRLRPLGERVLFRHASFDQLSNLIAEAGWETCDGILLDLGVSSPQLDSPGRGLSFQRDEPLDMRMDQDATIPTAFELLRDQPEPAIAAMLHEFGEEPRARRIARSIVARRERGALNTTADLRAAVLSGIGHLAPADWRIDPATRTFQAVRIAVNDELGQLRRVLPQAIAALRPGGTLVVIAFHSLEDRIVKQFLAEQAASCICPPGLPECRCGHTAAITLPVRKPVIASELEVRTNPRSRSAKLRVGRKLDHGEQPDKLTLPDWAI